MCRRTPPWNNKQGCICQSLGNVPGLGASIGNSLGLWGNGGWPWSGQFHWESPWVVEPWSCQFHLESPWAVSLGWALPLVILLVFRDWPWNGQFHWESPWGVEPWSGQFHGKSVRAMAPGWSIPSGVCFGSGLGMANLRFETGTLELSIPFGIPLGQCPWSGHFHW